jgi:hypothetical protein
VGFRFTGIFLHEDILPVEALEANWPGCRVRRIAPPCGGVGVAFASDDDDDDDTRDDESPDADVAVDDAQRRVGAWSQRHPGQPIAYVAADCFGGICLYEGFTCLDGRVIDIVPLTRRGDGGLTRLLQRLGIELGPDEDFPPLRRGYFDS